MADRIPLDDLTSDQLDQLYAELDQLRAGIPLICSDERHQAKVADLARIRDQWQWRHQDAERRVKVQRERAEQAEAELGDAWQKFANVCGQRDRLRLRMNALADRWDLEGPPPGNRPLTELRAEISIEPLPELERAEAERDGAYRERAQLLALLASLHPSVIAPAPDVDEDGWQILYLRIGGRQASWHIAPRDAELYAHVQHVPVDDSRAQWDGHTTDEKYAHIGQHAAQLYADARGRAETPLGPGEAAIARVTRALPAVRRALDSLPARCRYHGEDTDPRRPTYGAEACCDTGIPAQRRRLAEQALTALAALETP